MIWTPKRFQQIVLALGIVSYFLSLISFGFLFTPLISGERPPILWVIVFLCILPVCSISVASKKLPEALNRKFRRLHLFIIALYFLFIVSFWKTCLFPAEYVEWWMVGLFYSIFQGAVAIAHLADLAEGNFGAWTGPENPFY